MTKPKIDIMKPVINFLEKKFVKEILKKILGSAVMGGFKAWLIKTIATEFFDEIGKPLIEAAFFQAGYLYDRVDGKIIAKKIREARESGNETNYNDHIDGIFS